MSPDPIDQAGYALLDSGRGRKLEQFGPFRLVRPCAPAIWEPVLDRSEWERADAVFTRDGDSPPPAGAGLPESWETRIGGLVFKTSLTGFGHLGVFPEHLTIWRRTGEIARAGGRAELSILNLFAYTGGATLALAGPGRRICHVDASRPAVAWARENARLNRLEDSPIRWIVDDVKKFAGREIKRGVRYDGIILDPPSFGRGNKGQVFKIEQDLPPLLRDLGRLLSDRPLFVCLSAHTPGFTGRVLENLLRQVLSPRGGGRLESGDLVIDSAQSFPLTLGTYALWTR